MISGKFKLYIRLSLLNMGGWQNNRKIVVFESDDWGSIRMPGKTIYEKALSAGYRVDQNIMEKYDSLESHEDLSMLYDVLLSLKDYKGNHPVFTANCLVANPDFEKIRKSGFTEYHYEPVTETFKKYPHHSGSFNLWHEGLKEKVYFPQSHGREHLNVSLFMNDLQTGNPDTHFGFNNGMPGSISLQNFKIGNKYVEALNYSSQADKQDKLKIILEGLELFEKLLGYKSASFIPPNYIWSHDFDEAVAQKEVKFFQGVSKMKEPNYSGDYKYFKSQTGKENSFGQYYLVRNCVFEPSSHSGNDPVGHCLAGIDTAFIWKKPAIISTHRVNYIGSIFPENRNKNLLLLKKLLVNIINRWPEVEFLTTTELGYELVKSNILSKK